MNLLRKFQQLVPQIFLAISSLLVVNFQLTAMAEKKKKNPLLRVTFRDEISTTSPSNDESVGSVSIVATRKLLSGVSLSTSKGVTEVVASSFRDRKERLAAGKKDNKEISAEIDEEALKNIRRNLAEEDAGDDNIEVFPSNSGQEDKAGGKTGSKPTRDKEKGNDQPSFQACWCCYAALVMLSLVAISLGVGFILNTPGDSMDDGPDAAYIPAAFVPTRMPNSTNIPNNIPTPLPDTFPPTSTKNPTTDPVFYNWVFDLPVYSKEALAEPNSPQNQALDWMMALPSEHITSMEPWQTKQLFALVTFYYSMNGPEWPAGINWLNDYTNIGDECSWTYSLDTTGQFSQPCQPNGRYQALLLNGLQLSPHQAVVPNEVALLSELQSIQLRGNAIYAAFEDMLPVRMFRSEHLTHIDMSLNTLYGTLPEDLGWFTSLQSLSLQNNGLVGTIPTSIGAKLTQLQELNLASNSLTGTIPSEVGLMTALTLLDLSGNYIDFWTSGIPEEVVAMTNLQLVL